MAVNISPTVAVVNAQAKPYSAVLSATVDFTPGTYVWYVDGSSVYGGYGGASFDIAADTLNGPEFEFSSYPDTIRLVVEDLDSGGEQAGQYTTADQRTSPSVDITLRDQKTGVPITNEISVPETPVTAVVVGQPRITLDWTPQAVGQPSRSDIWVRVVAENEARQVGFVRVNWGDGNQEDIECHNYDRVEFERSHTYTGVTGSVSVACVPYTSSGIPYATGTLAVSIGSDSVNWRAGQYRIRQYRNQVGFDDRDIVSWRDITDATQSLLLHNRRRGYTYYHQLQLREIDDTGRPKLTSALSDSSSAGPW